MGKHVVTSVLGIFLGLAAVAWIRPNTSAATVFLLLMSVGVANAIGFIVAALARRRSVPGDPPK